MRVGKRRVGRGREGREEGVGRKGGYASLALGGMDATVGWLVQGRVMARSVRDNRLSDVPNGLRSVSRHLRRLYIRFRTRFDFCL